MRIWWLSKDAIASQYGKYFSRWFDKTNFLPKTTEFWSQIRIFQKTDNKRSEATIHATLNL